MNYEVFKSQLGCIRIDYSKDSIIGVSLVDSNYNSGISSPISKLAIKEIKEYLLGTRKKFSLKYRLKGTDFQLSVWNELSKIKYGKTVSYSYIAKKINKPKAQRAVGLAIKNNPLFLVVPCHRVIGKNGKLTGFTSGGIEVKKQLLELEKAIPKINI